MHIEKVVFRLAVGEKPVAEVFCSDVKPVPGDVREDTVTMDFSSSGTAQREAYVLPALAPFLAVQGAVLGMPRGPSETLVPRSPDEGSGPLAKVSRGGRTYEATWAVVPLPFGDELDGFDAESAAALQALGYLDADHQAGASGSSEPPAPDEH